jgi:hypothetical protein
MGIQVEGISAATLQNTESHERIDSEKKQTGLS